MKSARKHKPVKDVASGSGLSLSEAPTKSKTKRKLKKKATGSKASLPSLKRLGSREPSRSKPLSTSEVTKDAKVTNLFAPKVACDKRIIDKSFDGCRDDSEHNRVVIKNVVRDNPCHKLGDSLGDDRQGDDITVKTTDVVNQVSHEPSPHREKMCVRTPTISVTNVSRDLSIGRKCSSIVNGGKCGSPLNGGKCSSPLNGGKCSSPQNGGKCSSPLNGGKCNSPFKRPPDRDRRDNTCSNMPGNAADLPPMRRPRSSKTRKHPTGLFKLHRPPSVIRTSPRKYTEYGPSTHKHRERAPLPKPYKELYKYLQRCKFPNMSSSTNAPGSAVDPTSDSANNSRYSLYGSAVDPDTLTTSHHPTNSFFGSAVDPDCMASALVASKSLHGSPVDPENVLSSSSHSTDYSGVDSGNQELGRNSINRQQLSECPKVPDIDPNILEDDEEEVEEGKGHQDATSGDKLTPLSESLQQRHLADMVELGKDVEPRHLTRALRDKGYFDYSYSYDKFSRTTTTNDNIKEGKKKSMEHLYAIIGKRVPRITDYDTY